jgi:hypothetical protein
MSARMEFLNVLAIKKLALAKGCTAERTATIKYKHYVRLIGPDGGDIPRVRGVGLGLTEAKRKLEAMPDRFSAQGLFAGARGAHTLPKSGAKASRSRNVSKREERAPSYDRRGAGRAPKGSR